MPNLQSATVREKEDALVLRNITQEFPSGNSTLRLLSESSLTLQHGERVVLSAPSGSGKSTLLHIAALLARPSSGSVTVAGETLSPSQNDFEVRASILRARNIGFVYQSHHLLNEFSALENVMLAQRIAQRDKYESHKRAVELLYRVSLRNRMHHRPQQLSGGERQRVAIARALANDPAILLADEPTGNLDAKLRVTVFEMMMEVADRRAVLVATHDPLLAKSIKRRVSIHGKKLLPA